MSVSELSLDEIKRHSLQILIEIAKICDRQGITYFLGYGTLIGAIRHKGFIPWDDDIDVLLPRNDYNRLAQYFIKNERNLYPLKLFGTSVNDKYPYAINRICNVDYIIHTDNEADCGMGIFVDLYPLDGLGNNYGKAKIYKIKANMYSSLCFLSTRKQIKKSFTKGKAKQFLKIPAFVFAHILGKDYFIKKLDEIQRKTEYRNSKYVANLIWGAYMLKDIYLRKWFQTSVDVEFEGYQVKAPIGYREYLTHLYGDYMKMPPENERYAHHFYKVYKKCTGIIS